MTSTQCVQSITLALVDQGLKSHSHSSALEVWRIHNTISFDFKTCPSPAQYVGTCEIWAQELHFSFYIHLFVKGLGGFKGIHDMGMPSTRRHVSHIRRALTLASLSLCPAKQKSQGINRGGPSCGSAGMGIQNPKQRNPVSHKMRRWLIIICICHHQGGGSTGEATQKQIRQHRNRGGNTETQEEAT